MMRVETERKTERKLRNHHSNPHTLRLCPHYRAISVDGEMIRVCSGVEVSKQGLGATLHRALTSSGKEGVYDRGKWIPGRENRESFRRRGRRNGESMEMEKTAGPVKKRRAVMSTRKGD
jgi:hypothetical protein